MHLSCIYNINIYINAYYISIYYGCVSINIHTYMHACVFYMYVYMHMCCCVSDFWCYINDPRFRDLKPTKQPLEVKSQKNRTFTVMPKVSKSFYQKNCFKLFGCGLLKKVHLNRSLFFFQAKNALAFHNIC